MHLPDPMCLTLDTEGTVFTQRPPFSIPQDPPLPFLAFVQDTDLKSNEFAVIWEQGLYSQAPNFNRYKGEKTLLSAAVQLHRAANFWCSFPCLLKIFMEIT